MYICICRAVTDTKIRQAIADGASSIEELQSVLGLGNECGKCIKAAMQLIEQQCDTPLPSEEYQGIKKQFV